MASFKPKEVVSILQKLGFAKKRQTGSHFIMFHPHSQIVISVPMHTKDVKKGLMRSIIKQAQSAEEEFIKLK
ncbi:type II toxin-antitoxin system HicA family toxin [Patescibacteria group bacterium]|nr:type II toxin-antitoxin system HicA family toxin [Patescibacteria group bacterium]